MIAVLVTIRHARGDTIGILVTIRGAGSTIGVHVTTRGAVGMIGAPVTTIRGGEGMIGAYVTMIRDVGFTISVHVMIRVTPGRTGEPSEPVTVVPQFAMIGDQRRLIAVPPLGISRRLRQLLDLRLLVQTHHLSSRVSTFDLELLTSCFGSMPSA